MQFFEKLDLETVTLALGSIAFISVLVRFHMSKHPFDIKTTITDKSGRFSLNKFGQMVALLVSTWVLIYQTRHAALTEWLFAGYMAAWTGANLLNKYLDRGNRASDSLNKDIEIGDYNEQDLDNQR